MDSTHSYFAQLRGKSALVTGATGFVGSVLARKLCERGVRVKAIVRAQSDRSVLKDFPIEWIAGDLCDESRLKDAVRDVEYVFQLATSFRDGGASEEIHKRLHVDATQALARAAMDSARLKRYVHTSTIGVHGHIDHPPANEEAPFHAGDEYQRTKLEGELWIREFSREYGLPFTVTRPATVYGPGDRRIFKLFKMARKGWFPIVGSGQGLLHLVHVEDLTDLMLLQAVHPRAAGEVFIGAGPKPSTLKEVVKKIGEAYGTRVQFIHVPAAPVFLIAQVLESVCIPLGLKPPIYPRRVAFFTKDRAFTTEKAKRLLGFSPSVSDELGIRDLARWYVENGWIPGSGIKKAEERLDARGNTSVAAVQMKERHYAVQGQGK